mgnify:CR=1 FL=1
MVNIDNELTSYELSNYWSGYLRIYNTDNMRWHPESNRQTKGVEAAVSWERAAQRMLYFTQNGLRWLSMYYSRKQWRRFDPFFVLISYDWRSYRICFAWFCYSTYPF